MSTISLLSDYDLDLVTGGGVPKPPCAPPPPKPCAPTCTSYNITTGANYSYNTTGAASGSDSFSGVSGEDANSSVTIG